MIASVEKAANGNVRAYRAEMRGRVEALIAEIGLMLSDLGEYRLDDPPNETGEWVDRLTMIRIALARLLATPKERKAELAHHLDSMEPTLRVAVMEAIMSIGFYSEVTTGDEAGSFHGAKL